MIRILTLTASVVCLAAIHASGAEFLTGGGSARSAATAGAWSPASDNILDAMALNPAGLALIDAPRLDLTLMGGIASGHFNAAGGAQGTLHALGGVPFGAFGAPLGRGNLTHRFTLGVAATPELLSSANWRYADPKGGVGGVSYGSVHSISAITAMRTSAGAGLYLSSRVQVGVTVGTTLNSNELNTAYVFQNYQPLAGLKTLLTLRTSGYGWNTTAGILTRPSKRLQVGASWHSRTTIRSTGEAAGNAGVQFAAIGLGAARPDFRYRAEVDNVLPQSVTAHITWQANSRTQLIAEAEGIGWASAFRTLPVHLSTGNNADINGLLGTSSFSDAIPLNWRDQLVARFAFTRNFGERGSFRAGYAHANNPVPGATLSPLTAAIGRHTISAGAGYSFSHARFDAAWSIDPTASANAGQSLIRSGEFDNSRVSLRTQAVVLTLSVRP